MVDIINFPTLLFLFSNKVMVCKAGIHNMLVRIANRKALIRLLLQKQSDLGLHCLFRHFLHEQLVYAPSLQLIKVYMVAYVLGAGLVDYQASR